MYISYGHDMEENPPHVVTMPFMRVSVAMRVVMKIRAWSFDSSAHMNLFVVLITTKCIIGGDRRLKTRGQR